MFDASEGGDAHSRARPRVFSHARDSGRHSEHALDGFGEEAASLGVVGEHVHGRGRRCQQHRGPFSGHVRGGGDHGGHDRVLGGCLCLGAFDLHHGKGGGTRVQVPAVTCTVGTEEYGSAHAVDGTGTQLGGVRVQGLADTFTVGTEEYGYAHTVDGSGNQLVHLGPLEQTSGDPHHGVEGVQRCGGGVRVGGLGVVHVVHTGDRGHVLNT